MGNLLSQGESLPDEHGLPLVSGIFCKTVLAGIHSSWALAAPDTSQGCPEAVGGRSALRAGVESLVCLSLLVGSQPSPDLSLTGPAFKIWEQWENLLYKQVERITQHHMHP